jgi:FKBP-type peptidyl-prolyl cis-trans isomerase FkpA
MKKPKRLMKRAHVTVALLLAVAATAAACDGDPTAIDARDVTFAPELGVDLDAMTRLSSGLYLQDLEEGTGTTALAGRTVGVLYRGWLPDGTLFDERQNATNPFRFRLGAGMVIAGWDQGLQGMRAGGVRRLVIPPSLGYGDRPTGAIPPNSVLVFEIRLLSVDQ